MKISSLLLRAKRKKFSAIVCVLSILKNHRGKESAFREKNIQSFTVKEMIPRNSTLSSEEI